MRDQVPDPIQTCATKKKLFQFLPFHQTTQQPSIINFNPFLSGALNFKSVRGLLFSSITIVPPSRSIHD
jgi:hypothetical protein